MKLTNIVLALSAFLLSCNDSQNKGSVETDQPAQSEHLAFFPVTDFISGQIAEIKKEGINPIKITSINNRQDSAWLKVEELDNEFAPFLSPVIDSTNLAGLFSEKSFLDQTVNAFTLTYDPIKQLPDSFSLQRWDVYIDPQSNTVRRVYLLKKSPDDKTSQLTWQSGKSCKIVTISKDNKGNDHVEKEVTIKWDF